MWPNIEHRKPGLCFPLQKYTNIFFYFSHFCTILLCQRGKYTDGQHILYVPFLIRSSIYTHTHTTNYFTTQKKIQMPPMATINKEDGKKSRHEASCNICRQIHRHSYGFSYTRGLMG